MADIGAKISLDGAKQFRDELKNLTQQGKTLSAQMGELASSFDAADNKEEILGKATENLTAQINNQKAIVDKLTAAVAKSSEEKGADATETLKLKEQLAKAETTLNKLEGTTAESAVGMKTFADKESDVSKESNKATGKIGAMQVAMGNLASEAIKAGLKGIADIAKQIAKYFIDATKGAAEFADEMLTLSAQTGMSTDSLQEYKYMASLLDTDLETITGSMSKLTKNMANAKSGSGSAAEAFKKLGVSITDDNGNLRDANAVFDDAIDALGRIDNETERDAVAMALFGKSAQELNPLIKASGDTIADLRQEAHDVGYVMSGETLDSMSQVQDGFDRLGLAADSLKNQFGSAIGGYILPYLNQLVSAFQNLVGGGSIDDFSDAIGDMLNDLLSDLASVLPKILKAGGQIVNKLAQGLIQMLPSLFPLVNQIISSIAMWLMENLGQIVQTGTQLVLSIITGIAEMLPELIPAAVEMVLTVTQGLLENVGNIITAAVEIVMALVNGLLSPESIAMIIGAIPTLIQGFITGILDNLETILKSGITIIVSLIQGFYSAIPEIIKAIPQIISGVVDTLLSFDWIGLGLEMLEMVADGIVSAAKAIWEAITGAFSAAFDWLTSLPKQAIEWGKDIIRGFIDGITAGAKWLWDKLKSIGKGIKDWLGFSRPKLGPLHYYEEWMPDMMMGLAKGIDDNAWRVQDALRDATGGMTLSGRTTNVEMGGVAVNVYAAPNQDANAIARQVMAVMQNEYNAKKAVFA